MSGWDRRPGCAALPSADRVQPTAVPTGAPARERARIVLLLSLTFVTGVVDVVSYVGLDHVFVANMTGNVVLLGAVVTAQGSVPIVSVAAAFAAFVLGAAVAGRVSNGREGSGAPAAILLGASTVLLAGSGALLDVAPLSPLVPAVPMGALALAMGLQGGWARAHAAADLPTVVVTSTLVGLAFQSALGTGEHQRWRRRAAAVTLLVLGGLAGGLLLRVGPGLALGLCAGITAAVAVVSWRVERCTTTNPTEPRIRPQHSNK
ncbi:YoaK family protein [Pseudonocardia sp.]|uniref:YoaK family protein n=1 Tax=Pseudonocardia sp. TaxID=60912 RepID=UPI003D149E21